LIEYPYSRIQATLIEKSDAAALPKLALRHHSCRTKRSRTSHSNALTLNAALTVYLTMALGLIILLATIALFSRRSFG
jgi:hypothetical protein